MPHPSPASLLKAAFATAFCAALMLLSVGSASAAAPSNDNLADAQTLLAQSFNVSGSTTGATLEPGEPEHHNSDENGGSVWYRWYAPTDGGTIRVDACESTGAKVAVYLQLGFGMAGLFQIGEGGCKVYAPNFGSVYIAVDSEPDFQGDFTLVGSVHQPPANNNFNDAVALTGNDVTVNGTNIAATVEVGEPAHGSGRSVWYRWTAPSTGLAYLEVCELHNQEVAAYTGSSVDSLTLVSRDDSCATTFPATAGQTYRVAVFGEMDDFRLRVSVNQAPANDNLASAQLLSGKSGAVIGDNRGATSEIGEINHTYSDPDGSVWYRWAPPESGIAVVKTCDAGAPWWAYNKEVFVYSYPGSNPTYANLVRVAPVESYGLCTAAFSATAGTNYRIVVDGQRRIRGPFELRFDVYSPPTNSEFANAVHLSGNWSVVSGSTAGANLEESGGISRVWYRWTAPKNGVAVVNVCDSPPAARPWVGVYTGSNVNDLEEVDTTESEGGCEQRFAALAGTTYRISPGHSYEDQGPFTLKVGYPVRDLSVARAGTGSGSVTSSPAGINCGGTCTSSFDQNSIVVLTAAAAGDSLFTGWSGACAGTGTCQVTLDQARSVTAQFDQKPTYALSVTRSGSGGGTVSSDPNGIACGSNCSSSYIDGTQVALTAAPVDGSRFVGWSGACSGTGTCQVTMSEVRSVTAQFSLIPDYALTVNKTGNGFGTVTSNPAGISCGSTCSSDFTEGATVTLAALATQGSTFEGWSGACSGTGACEVTMNEARAVTARFLDIPDPVHLISVSKSGAGSGSVSSGPSGIDCGSTCAAEFVEGTTVTLTATASAGSSFGGWSGSCSGTGTCEITVDRAASVTASFAKIPDPGQPVLGPLRVTPVAKTVKRGKTATFRVKVTNTGTATAANVKVCVKAPAKLIKLRRCATIGSLDAGASATAVFKGKVPAKARRGARATLLISAIGTGVTPKSAKATLKVG